MATEASCCINYFSFWHLLHEAVAVHIIRVRHCNRHCCCLPDSSFAHSIFQLYKALADWISTVERHCDYHLSVGTTGSAMHYTQLLVHLSLTRQQFASISWLLRALAFLTSYCLADWILHAPLCSIHLHSIQHMCLLCPIPASTFRTCPLAVVGYSKVHLHASLSADLPTCLHGQHPALNSIKAARASPILTS